MFDIYLKIGIVVVGLLILCAIVCNFRAKNKSLNEVAFSI